jgi:hypothetical protein
MRLKLKQGKLLSSFALNFNVHHYTKDNVGGSGGGNSDVLLAAADATAAAVATTGGAVQVDRIKIRVESAPGFSV